MTSTKIDKSEIAFAGVDSGLKMFSSPVEGAAAAVSRNPNTKTTVSTAVRVIEFFTCRISLPRDVSDRWSRFQHCTLALWSLAAPKHIPTWKEFFMPLLGYGLHKRRTSVRM